MSQQVAGLMRNGTVLTDNVLQFERNLSAMEKTKCCLNFRSETSHLEKALQITNNKTERSYKCRRCQKTGFYSTVSEGSINRTTVGK
jgi:hypothetical protein